MTASNQHSGALDALERLYVNVRVEYPFGVRDWEIVKDELGNLEEQCERLQHIADCADTPLMRDVLAERDGLKEQLEAAELARRPVPTNEGGPGHEERYWLRAKLDGAIQHLRDIEDFYRLRGGLPESYNMARADRARSLYEQITEDFVNGKLGTPTLKEQLEALRGEVRRAQASIALELYAGSRSKTAEILREALNPAKSPS